MKGASMAGNVGGGADPSSPSLLQKALQGVGNFVDITGNKLGLPEWNLSEKIAGGNTVNTIFRPQVKAFDDGVDYTQFLNQPNLPVLGPEKPPGWQPSNTNPSGGNSGGGNTGGGNSGGGNPGLAGLQNVDWYYNEFGQQVPIVRNQEPKVDPLQAYRDALNNSYRELEGNLDPWRAQSEANINQQYNLGLNDINLQKQAGLDSLIGQRQRVETNQVRNLKDLANSVGQAYNSFSNQLGVMGAGDSSASRVMLPYALSRMEAQQRGNITRGSQDAYAGIDERESNLNNMVLQETNRLNQSKLQEMSALGEWYNNARNQIAQMKGQDVRALAENVLMSALNKADQINQQYTARQNSLRDWATGISQNIGQLKSNLAAVSDPRLLGNLPQMSPVGSSVTGYTPANYQAPVGFGFGTDDERLRM